ncbi:TIGR02680 family protein [Kitasatospora sp. NPDC052868]|uniref:TIGR02680 family protein n=1 Tax=Kitasatospora sp. NPDC052868 TaxID=3364060 RepID=UPI0037C8C595
MSRQSTPAAPHEHAAHRYRLHRAGIRNVWQYDEQEFLFGEGRLLLRGKNGAGKSKALEMLLPYLLDGDARALDATGTGRTTLAWLMLDGFEQTNRLGYLWVEFRGTDAEGAERFLTIGAAVRASKSTNTAKPYFFTTTRRVGTDLLLAEAGQPLSLDRLRTVVGAENVLERPTDHRARVARDLFGLTDSARYRNLTQLLHRLRRPTIGDRIESGGLVTVLSETLPALDEDVVEKVARNLDDLDSVRDDLGRLEKTDTALRHFLGGYRGYLHGVLRRRAGAVDRELAALADRRKAAGDAAQLVGGLRIEEAEATAVHDRLRTEQEEAKAELSALRQSTGYRSLQELGERRRTVAAVRAAAEAAFEMLRVAHEGEHAAGAAVSAGADRVGTALRRFGDSHRDLRDAAERSGIGPAHLGEQSSVPAVVLQPAGEEELLDPDGVARPVGRNRVTAYDTEALAEALRLWDASLTTAEPVVKARMRTVAELSGLLAHARSAAATARDADVERERLGEQAEQATELVRHRRLAVLAAGDGYAAQVIAWAEHLERLAGTPSGEADGPPGDLRALVARDESGDGSFADQALPADVGEVVARSAERIATPALNTLAEERDRTTLRVHGLSSTLDEMLREKHAWEQRTDPEPPRPAHRTAAHAGQTGAPLYRTVDFADGLTAPEQAGLEAALEAGGLLDAWITAEGALLDPLTQDTLLRPGPAVADSPTLTAALRPAVAPGGAVTADRVEALLASVALVPVGAPFDETAHSAISPDGRWRLGVARGAYTKAQAEYVGAESRAATRRRHIAELADRIGAARQALHEERARLTELTDRLGTLTTTLRNLPRTQPLTDAWARLAAAEQSEDALAQATAAAATRADQARAASAAARRQSEATATAHALPVDPALLDTVREALRDLTAGTGRLRRDLLAAGRMVIDHRTERGGFEDARTRRAAAASAYAGRRGELAESRREIRTLEESVGASEQQLLAAEDAIGRRLAAAADQAPRAGAKASELHDRRVRAEQDEQVRREELGTQETAVIQRGRELRTALAAPEVLRGAALAGRAAELTAPDPAHDDARTRLRALRGLLDHLRGSLDPERRDISDTTLLNRFNDLRDQLAGGYDAALEEPDGVKVCRLVDDTGQHDVALVGERIAAQAGEARARLTERERDVFQRFLTGELGDNLSGQVLAAGALVNALNDTLRSVRTSHGLGVELDWRLADTVDADVRAAVELLRSPSGLRTREQSEHLREVLQRRIEDARRADPAAGYAAHLRTALDYRSWFTFQPWVVDESATVRRRKLTGRTGLSQGEQRVLSYLVLFAAAAAHFSTLAESTPHAPRVILLDDAFAKVDEPTHARLGRILVDLDLDFVLTSERLMGNWPDVPSLHIYECLRDPHHRGVATLHYTWNGRNRRLMSG